MQSKELVNFRIGNYILDTNKNKIVKMDFGIFESIHYNRYQMYVPIPLTNEWLEKFGFVKDKIDNTYYKDNFEIMLPTYSIYKISVIKDVRYVHQLQNLYSALEQKELELKAELKKLRVADVSGRIEHFVCGFCGGNKMLNIGDGGHGCDECGHYQYTN